MRPHTPTPYTPAPTPHTPTHTPTLPTLESEEVPAAVTRSMFTVTMFVIGASMCAIGVMVFERGHWVSASPAAAGLVVVLWAGLRGLRR